MIVVAGIAVLLSLRKRRTERLRSKFGGAEYARAVKEGGNRRHAEAGLEEPSGYAEAAREIAEPIKKSTVA